MKNIKTKNQLTFVSSKGLTIILSPISSSHSICECISSPVFVVGLCCRLFERTRTIRYSTSTPASPIEIQITTAKGQSKIKMEFLICNRIFFLLTYAHLPFSNNFLFDYLCNLLVFFSILSLVVVTTTTTTTTITIALVYYIDKAN
jgi:hypothetical protein